MPFTDEEAQSLLLSKAWAQRLQQMGLDDVATLAAADLDDVLEQGAQLTGSTCWKNSPQAKAAVSAAITWAKQKIIAK